MIVVAVIALIVSIVSATVAVLARIEIERYKGAFWKLEWAEPPMKLAIPQAYVSLTNIGQTRARKVDVVFAIDPTRILFEPEQELPWDSVEPGEVRYFPANLRFFVVDLAVFGTFSSQLRAQPERAHVTVTWTTALGYRRHQRLRLPDPGDYVSRVGR